MGQFQSIALKKALEKEEDVFERGEGTTLNLQGLTISEKDAKLLADTFKKHQSLGERLQLVQLGACSLSPTAIHNIVTGIARTRIASTITRIDLSTSSSIPEGNPLGNDGSASIALFIRSCKNLQHMKAAACQLECGGMSDISAAVSSSTSLRTLDLSYNNITDTGAQYLGSALAASKSLQGFSLWRNLITSEGCKYLAEGLSENSSLKWLGLGCNSIGDKGMEYLMEALVDNIANCKLTWLALGNNNISDDGIEKLAEFLTAGWTSIDDDEGEEGVACPVTSLGLGGNEIGDRGAKELAQALDVNDKLLSLGLSCNKIGDEGAKALAEMLRSNQTLENLSLSSNRIGTDGGETLIASLCDNTTLSKLLLAQNPLDDAVCMRCIEVFSKHNLTLQVLDLNDTNISPAALKNFVAHLKKSKSKINRASLGEHILTMSEKEHKNLSTISGNPLEVANWRPPPASEVPQQDIFKLADRTRKVFNRPNMAVPLKKDQEDDYLRASSDSSLDLELPMFSGGLVDQGEGEGEVAGTNTTAPVVRLLSSDKRRSAWRHSRIVEESFEIEPLDVGSDTEDDKTEETLIEEEEEGEGNDISKETTITGEEDEERDRNTKKVNEPVLSKSTDRGRLQAMSEDKTRPIKFKVPKPPPPRKPSNIESKKPSTSKETKKIIKKRIKVIPLQQKEEEEEEEWEESEPQIVPDKLNTLSTQLSNLSVSDEDSKTNGTSTSTSTSQETSTHYKIITSNKPLTTPTTSGHKDEPHYKILTTNKPLATPTSSKDKEGEPHYKIVTTNKPLTTDKSKEGGLHYKTVTSNKPLATPTSSKDKDEEEEPHYKIVTRSYKEPLTMFGYKKKEPVYDKIPEKERSLVENTSDKSKFPHQTSNEEKPEKEPLYDTIPRQPILTSATKDRPRPPTTRRHPSVSLSQSMSLISEGEEESGHSYVNIGADGNVFLEGSESEGEEDDKKVLSLSGTSDGFRSRPIKEQWVISLKQRSGVLKMGGFIHKGYNELKEFMKTIEYNNFMAELTCNETKNRPAGPLAPSHTRVKLQRVMEDLGSDYINANFVGSPLYPKSYIIAQWPMENTIPTFWRMIWETNASVIVVLGDADDKNNFWPEKEDYQLHPAVILGEWYTDSLYVRTDKVHHNTSSVEGLFEVSMVIHSYDDDVTEHLSLFHYSTWPQNGVPQSPVHVGHLFHHSLAARTRGPLVIVSAHGGGRAGCYGVVSVAYELLNMPDTPQSFDADPNIIDSVFRGLLGQRPGLVANQRQFDFCHRILEECLWGVASKGLGGTEEKGKGTGRLFNIFKKKKRTS